jgi:hypothetical protein
MVQNSQEEAAEVLQEPWSHRERKCHIVAIDSRRIIQIGQYLFLFEVIVMEIWK